MKRLALPRKTTFESEASDTSAALRAIFFCLIAKSLVTIGAHVCKRRDGVFQGITLGTAISQKGFKRFGLRLRVMESL
jgi:hypothetical protein